jgi:predicted nucleic acid-binding Zn ribbon protein
MAFLYIKTGERILTSMPYPRTMVTVPIPQHKHCQVCGKAIRSKETVCSGECKANLDKTVKRKQLWLVAYIGAAMVMVVVVFLSMGG